MVRLAGGVPVDVAEALRTRDAMASRGPDGAGLWSSAGGDVVLAHRRLAIIDLSPGAAQPFSSADSRYVLAFNGEVYNFRELRKELESKGERFRTTSDTEVLLALLVRHGPRALPRVRGMYALAFWDDREHRLLLARDPYGIKPLYVATSGGVLRFSSQVKALMAGGGIDSNVDPRGVGGFLLWGYVPEPFTIHRDVRCFPAGHYLEVVGGTVRTPQQFARLEDGPAAVETPHPSLAQVLEESVALHLVADVPVAIFLSAGLDSALVAALAARRASGVLQAVTLTFPEFVGTADDEGPVARHVAHCLGLEHVERCVARDEFLGLWEDIVAAMDQPSIDGFNTYLVSRVAHQAGVKTALSGLGGDELFGSYPSFRAVPRWQRLATLARAVQPLLPRAARLFAPGHPKVTGLPRLAGSIAGAYFLRRGLFLPWEVAEMLVDGGWSAGDSAMDPLMALEATLTGRRPDPWVAVHLLESEHYMRNQLLRDADWASMAHSLELRVPLVDPVVQRAMAQTGFEPARSKGKAALIREIAPELPAVVFRRRKTGFFTPVAAWLGLGEGPRGATSRMLALRILKAFGIPLRLPLSVAAKA